jgi:hypothetical protein
LGKRQGRRFHFQRRRFEPIVERKSRRRQLTDDGNVEVTGCDLREKIRQMDSTIFSSGRRR